MLAAPPDVAPSHSALVIHADAKVFAAQMGAGDSVSYELGNGRSSWVQVVQGEVELGGEKLSAGDGSAITDEQAITLKANEMSELLLFDLATP